MATMRMATVLVVAACCAVAEIGLADDRVPDATITLTGGSVAAGVGIEWGSGTLTYQGKRYPIAVKGLTVGGVGARSVEASGKVYSLKKLADFPGRYTSLHTGVTAAEGVGISAMTNDKGVTIELLSTTQGIALSLGGGGVDISIRK